MKKLSKRIISLLMAIVMTAGVLAIGFTVSAEDDDKTAYQNVKANEFYHDVGKYEEDEEGNSTFEKSGTGSHTYVEVIDETGNENNGDPVYLHPDYTGNTAFVCIECGHEKGESGNLDIHKQYIVKSDTEQASCESWPKETYRCRHCGGVYYVKTGMELGHYWPVEIDNQDRPSKEDIEFYQYVPADDPKDDKMEKVTISEGLKLKDDIKPVWGDGHESCTITLKCVRCGKEMPYSVYTMTNEIGRVYRTTDDNVEGKCGETVIYTALFTIPNMAIDADLEGLPYYYFAQEYEDAKDHTSFDKKEYVYDNFTGVNYELDEAGIVKEDDGSIKTVDDLTVYGEGSLKKVETAECTVDGSYDVYEICKVCGKTFNKETVEVKAPGHTFDTVKEIVKPTCTEKGLNRGHCSVCGNTEDVEVPALGHEFTSKVGSTAPTCLEPGTITMQCKRCTERETKEDENRPALGHDFWYTSNNDAKCTTDGTKTGVCTRCKQVSVEADYGSALGHDWVETGRDKPTCSDNEVVHYKCSRCNIQKQEEIYGTGGHVYYSYCQPTGAHEKHYVYWQCERCGEIWDTIDVETCKDLNYDFKCDYCDQDISFFDHWLHYLVGWPMYHISVAIRNFIKL